MRLHRRIAERLSLPGKAILARLAALFSAILAWRDPDRHDALEFADA